MLISVLASIFLRAERERYVVFYLYGAMGSGFNCILDIFSSNY